jgi:glycine amidinotransferase
MPANEPAFEAKLKSDEHALHGLQGLRSESAIAKGEEELEGLVSVLEKHGVKVRRPELVDWSQPCKTPDFEVPCGNTGAMPRDVLLTVGNEVLEAPMSWRSRFFEYRAYRSLLNEYFELDPNFVWTAAPKPTMTDAMFMKDFPHEARGGEADNRRQILAEHRIFCHTEAEPIFDAADVMRLGKDLFVCNSFTTNRKGYDWLRRHYNQRGLRVHFFDFPADTAPMHLDVNFVPLSKDTVMLNPQRPPRPWVERLLRENGWKVIVGVSNGISPPPLSQCSEWLALNVLSIDDKKVICEAEETNLHELLSQHGFEPIPVPLRSIAEFGGAFHCCTTDVRREGSLESYFPHIDELEAKGLECQFAPYGAESPAAYVPAVSESSVPHRSRRFDVKMEAVSSTP